MPGPHEITVSQLARLVGTPACPTLIDICIGEDHAADPYLIPGATRHEFRDPMRLKDAISERAVIICQKGQKLSQGIAAFLRTEGVAAEYLSGGMRAWSTDFGAFRIPSAHLPPQRFGASLWVTRHRPKIDRIACPWLIRRFVDPAARFLFVAPSEVMAVADRLQATPFDVEGAPFTHDGALCTFDNMIKHFNLNSPALSLLARVVRGADTDRHDLHPACAGVLALSVGLSRQFRDDLAQLEHGMIVYDALYLWARDGQDESHNSHISGKAG